MKIIIQDTAHNSIESSFDYLSLYSTKNALETTDGIYAYIYNLEDSPYIGRYVPEIMDKHFRELIYRRSRNQQYRIIYYVSELTETIYVLYVANCKQDFNRILKIHNYFNNYLDF